MKFLILSILSLAPLSLAAATVSAADMPACATTCFATAIPAAKCGLTDYVCQCGSGKAAITASVTPCIMSTCNAADQATAANVAGAICAQVASGSSTPAGTTGTMAPSATSNVTMPTTPAVVATGAGPTNGPQIIAAGAAFLAAALL
jgi:hypothetical protein